MRLKEAAKLGFGRAVMPQSAAGEGGGEFGLALLPVASLSYLAADIAALAKTPPANTSGAGMRGRGERRAPQDD